MLVPKSKRNRVLDKMQVGSGYFSGQGMKGAAGDWVGEVGSALPTIQSPSHPTTSLPAKQWAQERSSGFLCAGKQPLLVFLTLLSPCAHVLGGPGQLVLLKDRAVGVARAVRGDYFCRFVKNKTKAGL